MEHAASINVIQPLTAAYVVSMALSAIYATPATSKSPTKATAAPKSHRTTPAPSSVANYAKHPPNAPSAMTCSIWTAKDFAMKIAVLITVLYAMRIILALFA